MPVGNAAGDDFSGGTPLIAADESYLIITSRRDNGFGKNDLYITFRDRKGGWTKPVNMGPTVNTEADERCPILSPDGKYLFFVSGREATSDIYRMDAGIIDELRKRVL